MHLENGVPNQTKENTMKIATDKLQQQLAKRQQAKAKIKAKKRISKQIHRIDAAKYEVEKAQIDLLNAKIALNGIPDIDKIAKLRAQAKIKAIESKLFDSRADLYTQQDKLKALKVKANTQLETVAQPDAVVEQPETVVAQPKTIVEQPETVVEQPETVVAQPKSLFEFSKK